MIRFSPRRIPGDGLRPLRSIPPKCPSYVHRRWTLMMPRPRFSLPSALLSLLAVFFGLAGAAQAQVAKQGNDILTSLIFQSDRLAPSQPVELPDNVQGSASASV